MYKSVEYCIKMQGGYADPIESLCWTEVRVCFKPSII